MIPAADPVLRALLHRWGFYMMLGSSFLILSQSGFVNLGMSFQMISSAIVGVWVGYTCENWISAAWCPWVALLAALTTAILTGGLMVVVRCWGSIDAVFVTFAFGLRTTGQNSEFGYSDRHPF
jgi:ABC-type uncharacterized transport system permease subunit